MKPSLKFAELQCITNFSFLKGASHPEEIVRRADELGYQAIAITDECSVAGVVRAYSEINDLNLNVKLIVGSVFFIGLEKFLLIAPSRSAYGQLCTLITRCRRRAEKGSYKIVLSDLENHLGDCICLWSPTNKSIDQPRIEWLKKNFLNRFWVLIERTLEIDDEINYKRILSLMTLNQVPGVCSSDVHMHHPNRKKLQDLLIAIDYNENIVDAKSRFYANAERHLRSLTKIKSLNEIEHINNSMEIANQCEPFLHKLGYEYPSDIIPGKQTPIEYLNYLVKIGIKKRFKGKVSNSIRKKIDKELSLIENRSFEHFFLTVYDIVKFARSRGILCQGRGSSANSVVCYLLEITEVDPNKIDVLFERFLSASRIAPPDIDVDFESGRREEVIQYIYKKYGRKRTAIAATVVTYKKKSALRDVGKALGLNVGQLEKVISNYGWRYQSKDWIDEIINDDLEGDNKTLKHFKTLVKEIVGFPRHLSQHVGGFIISAGPLAELVPIENATMEDRTVIQWDKDDLEALNLLKVDVLGLGMLTAIQKSLEYISAQEQRLIGIKDIPDTPDKAVFKMIQKADTVGTFQIESRAQMSMLPRLKPKCYYDLVVQVAIVRPGPIHGDMVHPYLKRRFGEEPVDYPQDELKPNNFFNQSFKMF